MRRKTPDRKLMLETKWLTDTDDINNHLRPIKRPVELGSRVITMEYWKLEK